MKILRIFQKDTPSSPLTRSFPTGGKPFGSSPRQRQPSPRGRGTALERAVDEGPFMRLRRISNANAYIENACVYIEMPQGIISFNSPLITAYAELPHPKVGGKPFGWSHADFSAFPGGKGDREERAVDEGCFRPTYASQLRNTAVTACIRTGKCLAGALPRSCVIVVTRLSRRVTPTRLEKNIFRPRGRRSLCSLGVRPKSFRASRFARLCVRPKNLSASRFARKFFSLPPMVGKVAFRPKGEMTDEGAIANC